MTELFFNTNALQLNYFESSDAGIPLLLLHGSSSRWQTFLPIIPHLTKFSHVYALDLRGHGKSSRAAQYQLSFFVEDICHFIQDHIKKPTVIFGHSSGGMMAMMTAALHPAWVKALIVGDAPLHLQVLQQLIDSECEIAQRIIAWLRDRKIDQIYATLQNDFRAESLSQCDPNFLSAMFDHFDDTFGSYDVEKLLPMIQCPVLFLRGNEAQGSLMRDVDVAHALAVLPRVKDVKFDGLGHHLFGGDVSGMVEEIKEFLQI